MVRAGVGTEAGHPGEGVRGPLRATEVGTEVEGNTGAEAGVKVAEVGVRKGLQGVTEAEGHPAMLNRASSTAALPESCSLNSFLDAAVM